jgi:hypothetical protein
MSKSLNGSSPSGAVVLPADSVAQGARRATEAAESAGAPDTQVIAIGKRRQFAGSEKQRILQAADRCKRPGEIGALLRKEGIYSSHLAVWRKQRSQGEASALAAHKRGRKVDPGVVEARRVDLLQRENAALRRRLAQAQEIIDVQKKLCTLLGLPPAESADESN